MASLINSGGGRRGAMELVGGGLGFGMGLGRRRESEWPSEAEQPSPAQPTVLGSIGPCWATLFWCSQVTCTRKGHGCSRSTKLLFSSKKTKLLFLKKKKLLHRCSEIHFVKFIGASKANSWTSVEKKILDKPFKIMIASNVQMQMHSRILQTEN
jgi:hypothetical protein